ncbi:MAG: bifunctional folylpolyglutamate synthase/dihydrofolate synthase [Candidatus Omnitrophica bacterium]|nr:bifunctional folylpolyglutamate synthase/dihydrofolate synthase [Candidatus Omnitrophota bacterium]MDD5552817.1 bifunctional folylpolyglutamate synthase/dihydrofolate synthase [Candidatus Omnitrophota bacterium]
MTYPETLQYLGSFINYEKFPAYPYRESFKLERVQNFLSSVGNPEKSLKCLHIAGTKGKGSTCAFIAYILRESGYKVGLYTSPHLSDFRERIRVLSGRAGGAAVKDFEGMIAEKELAELTKRLRPAIDEYNKNSTYGPLSFFEVYTSLAFIYFKEKKVDFAVLETGLGGRLDATNSAGSLVSAITPVSYEHTQKLGNTLREIAIEKAGIIKTPNSIVISAPQEEEAARVIRDKCRQKGAKLYEVGRDITYKAVKSGFRVAGSLKSYPGLRTILLGNHQLINASVAIGVIEALEMQGVGIEAGAIKRGLYNTLWPGRCEVLSRGPLIVLDGAQNTASMRALRETVKENFVYNKLFLVMGISSDKDIKGICIEAKVLADEVVLTKADNPRAADPRDLEENFTGKKTHITDSVKKAKELVLRIAARKDMVLVCGSLFVVGEFRDDQIRYQ